MDSSPDGARTDALKAGQRLGRYEILHRLASGGMATVYLGRATAQGGFERLVAVKVCHSHLCDDEDFGLMFFDEARLAARIHHPNVVGVIDVSNEGALYLVMEYIEGDRLSSLIRAAAREGRKLPIPVTLRIFADTLAGLHAAHELTDSEGRPLHIVHRDVSPQNILVGVDGVARITDFGIAKAEERAIVTRAGNVKGKVPYMAPEQLGGGTVTLRTDLFAAGIVLWETLTGRRLFSAENDIATANIVLFGDVPKPSSLAPDVSPKLDAAVMKALSRDPAKRFANASQFIEALENCDIPMAPARHVGVAINELLADALAERRSLVRRLTTTRPASLAPPSPNTSVADDLESSTALEPASQLTTIFDPRASEQPDEPLSQGTVTFQVTAAAHRIERRKGLGAQWILGLAGIVVVATAVLAGRWMKGSAAADSGHAVSSRQSAPPLDLAPSPHVNTAAAPALVAPPVDATPIAALQTATPPPDAATPPPRENGTRPPTRRSPPSPSTPTSTPRPRQHPVGNYHPEVI